MSDSVVKGGMHIDVVDNETDFLSLEAQWNELLEGSSSTIFQSFEWTSTWWKYFGGLASLRCILFRDEGTLVGIAPLYSEDVRVLGMPLVVRLQFIGRHLADYGDLIIRKGYESQVTEAFVGYLTGAAARWDLCDLEDLNESSGVLRELPRLLDHAVIGLSTYQGSVCPQRSLPRTWDEFFQSLGPNLRSNLKRKQKKLEEQFETGLEIFREASSGLEGAVNSFAAIHGDRWRSLGFPSAFDDPHHRGFHLELARRFASRGWLRLSFITVNGARIAVSFDFLFRRRIYMYQCNAAGPDDVMKFSPGMLIKAATIRAGIADGMEVYDFLRGDEPYKLSEWKSFNSKNYLLRLVNQRSRKSLRLRLFFMWELMQKSIGRAQREYYELRKYIVTQDPSLEDRVNFILSRMKMLLGLGARYLHRNLDDSSDPAGGGGLDERRADGLQRKADGLD